MKLHHIFIGDIHGQVRHVERALALEGKKIFVGDFMDSFTRPIEDHKKCLDLVIEAIEKGEAEAIYGNHELSYIMPRHRCSGHNSSGKWLMDNYKTRLARLFKPYILLEGPTLISHAGLTRSIWQEEELTLDLLPQILDEWWPNPHSPMHQIGRARGGPDDIGGMFWCDFNHEFCPIPELPQIFGHTAGKGIRQRDNAYCIDCLHNSDDFLQLDIDK